MGDDGRVDDTAAAFLCRICVKENERCGGAEGSVRRMMHKY
jgi:hypothetical protein